jgi:hypothetical protein
MIENLSEMKIENGWKAKRKKIIARPMKRFGKWQINVIEEQLKWWEVFQFMKKEPTERRAAVFGKRDWKKSKIS